MKRVLLTGANRELGWSADTPIEEVLLSAWKWQQGLKG
jgi:UDP-glucose 4-epimerase